MAPEKLPEEIAAGQVIDPAKLVAALERAKARSSSAIQGDNFIAPIFSAVFEILADAIRASTVSNHKD